MRVITKISTQKKNKRRFNVFINDEYAFSVSEQTLITYNLHKGKKLNDEDIVELVKADSFHQSYLKAIHYLSYRMRSIEEVNTYLLKQDIQEHDAEQIIVKLIEKGYLNDEQFAESFIKDQLNQTTKGPLLIKRDLLEKGVQERIVNQKLKLYTFEIELEKALKWAKRRIKRKSKDSYRKRLEKLRIGLIQRGFNHHIIDEVIQIVRDKVEDGTEWEGLVHQANKIYRRLSRRYEGYDLLNRLKANLYNRGFPAHLIDRYIDETVKED